MNVLITRSLNRRPTRCEGCSGTVQVNECLSRVGCLVGHKHCEGALVDAFQRACLNGQATSRKTRWGK